MGDEDFRIFPKGISSKANLITELEFEFAYFKDSV